MAFSTSSIAAIKGDTGATGSQGPQGETGPAGSVNTATDYTWTGSNRATPVSDADGSFDLDAGQNFTCTPSSAVTLTFTSGGSALSSTQSGQSGFILLDNGEFSQSSHFSFDYVSR